MIKSTCNAAEQARMRKLGLEGWTLEAIAEGMKITLKCVTANMRGHMVGAVEATEEVELVEVPSDPAPVPETPLQATEAAVPAAMPAAIPIVPPTGAPVADNRSPQQKAADTRKANAEAAAAAADSDPEFTE